jgi:hypothetical protein
MACKCCIQSSYTSGELWAGVPSGWSSVHTEDVHRGAERPSMGCLWRSTLQRGTVLHLVARDATPNVYFRSVSHVSWVRCCCDPHVWTVFLFTAPEACAVAGLENITFFRKLGIPRFVHSFRHLHNPHLVRMEADRVLRTLCAVARGMGSFREVRLYDYPGFQTEAYGQSQLSLRRHVVGLPRTSQSPATGRALLSPTLSLQPHNGLKLRKSHKMALLPLTQWFTAAFTRAFHLYLSWARPI